MKALATLLRTMGREAVPHAEEILGHMSVHFDQEPNGVVKCIRALFDCVFNPTESVPSTSIEGPRSPKDSTSMPGGKRYSE